MVSAGHVSGTRGSGIVSSTADVVRVMRGVANWIQLIRAGPSTIRGKLGRGHLIEGIYCIFFSRLMPSLFIFQTQNIIYHTRYIR